MNNILVNKSLTRDSWYSTIVQSLLHVELASLWENMVCANYKTILNMGLCLSVTVDQINDS